MKKYTKTKNKGYQAETEIEEILIKYLTGDY